MVYDSYMRSTSIEHSLSGTADVSPQKKYRAAQKVFDWRIAEEQHSQRVFDFLVANFDKPLSEDEYVQQVVLLRKLNLSESPLKGKKRANYRRTTCPSSAREEYRRLKNTYGFFAA